MTISLILFIFALVLFVIGAFPTLVEPYRLRLVSAGLAFYVAAQIFVAAHGLG